MMRMRDLVSDPPAPVVLKDYAKEDRAGGFWDFIRRGLAQEVGPRAFRRAGKLERAAARPLDHQNVPGHMNPGKLRS